MAATNLRTYRASTMAEALLDVKRDLGKDALILHARTVKVGGMLGVGGQQVVEITASSRAVAPIGRHAPATLGSMRQTAAGAGSSASELSESQTAVAGFVPTQFQRVSRATPPALVSPSVSQEPSKTARPETVRPDTVRPDTARPDTARPDTARPESAKLLRSKPVRVEVQLPDELQQNESVNRSKVSLSAQTSAPPSSNSPSPKASAYPVSEMPSRAEKDRARLAYTPVEFQPSTTDVASELRSELASIKSLVGQVLSSTRRGAGGVLSMGGLSAPLMAVYERLQNTGMSQELCEVVVGKVRDQAGAFNRDPSADLLTLARQAIAECFAMAPQTTTWGRQPDGRALTIAFVGPTGVGKTTTIAKLAANLKLRQGLQVGLLTADTYRIAAVDQLRTYANIIGLPVKVVISSADVAQALTSLAGSDVILIDSAGRSPQDSRRLGELRDLLNAARPHETHVVVSASTSLPVTVATLERFKVLSPDRMIMTKLDELPECGTIADLSRQANLPLSYVTTGQEVPDDLEPAQPGRLAAMIIDGELAR